MSANLEQPESPQIPSLDFHEFHQQQLPKLLESGNGALAAVGVKRAGALAFRLSDGDPGDAYTYAPRDGGIDIVPGDEKAETVIELERDTWAGLAQEYESAPGLIYGNKIRCTRGSAMGLMQWDPPLRAMYSGRPYYDEDAIHLEDRHGDPLDATRRFTLDDDPEDMAHFLRTAGFLLVRGVFSAEEAATYRAEAARLRESAVQGDKQSWWGKNAKGEEILCRVTAAGREPGLRALPADPRMLKLAALADEGLAPRGRGSEEGISVIWKTPGMAEGLGDLPWHRDCGMGGHAVMCPVMIASVFLTPANAETGALRVLPGSWRYACHFVDAAHPAAPKGVIVEAEPGDVSLHYGDTMHAAPPPGKHGPGTYRISAVTGYVRDGVRPHGGKRHYNDVLLGNEDGQVDHMTKLMD
jgi:hypothetical protein